MKSKSEMKRIAIQKDAKKPYIEVFPQGPYKLWSIRVITEKLNCMLEFIGDADARFLVFPAGFKTPEEAEKLANKLSKELGDIEVVVEESK